MRLTVRGDPPSGVRTASGLTRRERNSEFQIPNNLCYDNKFPIVGNPQGERRDSKTGTRERDLSRRRPVQRRDDSPVAIYQDQPTASSALRQRCRSAPELCTIE